MSRTLRYQISDWSQITDCLSNNSRNLYLTLSKHLDGNTLRDLVIQVNHTNYGVLFAAIIKGTGTLLSTETEDGKQLPFFTTEQILTELQRFGFYIIYDVKSNLPNEVLSFLATVDNLGFDKISRILVGPEINQTSIYSEALQQSRAYTSETIVFKSTEHNEDILTFGARIPRKDFNAKLAANSVMVISNDCEGQWDWVTYVANIEDILDENIDPTDDFETQTGIETRDMTPYIPTPEGYTVYTEDDPKGEMEG